MTRLLRRAGNVVIWLLLAFGVVGLGVWVATQFNWIQALVVTSGSMEPEISAGDILIARPVPAAEIVVGDVVSMSTPALGATVTHRVVEVTADGFILQGDANATADPQPYPAPDQVWRLAAVVPAAGSVLLALRNPTTLVSLGVVVLALLAASFLPDDDAPPSTSQTTDGTETTGPEPTEPGTTEPV